MEGSPDRQLEPSIQNRVQTHCRSSLTHWEAKHGDERPGGLHQGRLSVGLKGPLANNEGVDPNIEWPCQCPSARHQACPLNLKWVHKEK